MLLILQNVFLETAVEWENSHFSITLEQEIKDIHVHAICYKCEVSHRFIYRFYTILFVHLKNKACRNFFEGACRVSCLIAMSLV